MSEVVKLARLHKRLDDGSMEILEPARKALRLKLDAERGQSTPLQFLTAVWESNQVDITVRVAAALGAARFVHPVVHLVMPPDPPPTLRIVGGLPAMPGSSTIMPGRIPSPRTLADRRPAGPEPLVEPEPEPGFGPRDEVEAVSPCEPASSFEALDEPAGF
jgi:hypothetical protein